MYENLALRIEYSDTKFKYYVTASLKLNAT